MIFITGATGLVGSHVLVQLSNKGHAIRAMKRPTSDLGQARKVFNLYAKDAQSQWELIEWVDGDLNDVCGIDVMLQNVKQVYHCAAMVSFQPSERKQMMQINVSGTANLVNAALKNGSIAFCHVSSIAALGRDEANAAITEDTAWKKSPNQSNYALSKYASEREVWRAMAEGLDAVIVNPSVILGPGNWHSGSSELFSLVWKGLPFYSEGITGFVDVRDVAAAMILLMEQQLYGHRFILSAENLSYKDVFTWMAEGLGKKAPSIKVKKWMGELAWRWYWIIGKITGRKPAITRETARSSNTMRYFSSAKIEQGIGFQFIPIRESIRSISRIFLDEKEQAF